MADFKKLGKGVTGALAQAKQLAAAEREANLQRMLEPSKIKERLYHGTTATEGGKGKEAIRRLKPSKEGALGSGVYMTPSTPHASSYTGIPNDEAIALMSQGNDYSKKMADQFMADRAAGRTFLWGRNAATVKLLGLLDRAANCFVHGKPLLKACHVCW